MSEQPDDLPRYGYLGPEGTFTEAALLGHLAGRPATCVPFTTVTGALDAVRAGAVAGAMVPLENSVEGSVAATLDALASGEPLVIVAEAQVPVAFALLARGGTQLADVTRVTTHPHAEAQCRRWLLEHLPDALVLPAAWTAAAAAAVADPDAHFDRVVELRGEDIDYEHACGRNPVNGLLLLARKLGLKVSTIDVRNSGDTAGTRDRVVGYGAYVFA